MWDNTGVNYLVENGLLYEYSGTGVDFNWREIGEVSAQKTATGVEVVIPKSKLNELNASIRIGFGHLNANWSETGRIPNANTASIYNLTAKDCNCVEENLILNGLLNTNKSYQTNGGITSTEMISGNSTVVYNAGTSITLKNGFSVSDGVSFRAFIDGCTVNLNPELEEKTTSRTSISKGKLKKEMVALVVTPNPFQGYFSINYSLPEAGRTNLAVYDVLGKIVIELLATDYQDTGIYEFDVNGYDLEKGLYFVVLKMENKIVTKKLIKK